MLLIGLEWTALAISALAGTMLTLGSSAHSFSGTSFLSHLLPFAVTVAIWVVFAAFLLLVWIKSRLWLRERLSMLPAVLAVFICIGTIWFVFHQGQKQIFSDLRALVGGKQQAARITLEHQIYAAYRRHSQAQLQKMIDRSMVFNADINDAGKAFDVDVHILQGVAATESSFMPRTSHDGGHGLFQITAVPKHILNQASRRLDTEELDLSNSRHNTFIAAATLKHYMAEMKGDLFLGLLAYNIGPRNGGLRFIMQQYGADDFITMQPYLKELPRDYPIRVLSYALAFKLWQREGKLLAYQEGDNAFIIQRVGIPGFPAFF
ncbi:transglycosylase SLT domain-containing protein [Methylomonas sp. MgM2]